MNLALFSPLSGSEEFKRLRESLKDTGVTAVSGVPEGMQHYLASALAYGGDRPVLMVLPNELEAVRAAEDASQFLGAQAMLLPAQEIQFARGASSHEATWRRLDTLTKLCTSHAKLVCVSPEAMMVRMGSRQRFESRLLRLTSGSVQPPNQLISRLTRMGYERVDMVEGKGQCAMRGSILDVYPPSESNAVRIEFFDDEVDSIRSFDAISQRSLGMIKELLISPASEILLEEGEYMDAARRMRAAIGAEKEWERKEESLLPELPPLPEDDEDELPSAFDLPAPARASSERIASAKDQASSRAPAQAANPMQADKIGYMMQDADQLAAGSLFRRAANWANVLMTDTCSILDWMPDAVVLFCQPDQIQSRAEGRMLGFQEDLNTALERQEAVPAQQELLFHYDELAASARSHRAATLQDILLGQGRMNPTRFVEMTGKGVMPYQSQMKQLAEDCAAWRGDGSAIVLLSGGVARGRRLVQLLAECEVPATLAEEMQGNLIRGEVIVLPATISKGFYWPEAKLALVSDTDIYGTGYHKAKSRRYAGEKIASFTDINPGDYVVHESHGVGIYRGTVHLQSEGTYHDYLYIQYQDNDKLYVPTEQLDRVQKFIGAQGAAPKLNSLNGTEWQRQKSKVQSGLKAIAFDLVKLYAQRLGAKGFAFSPASPWTKQFEDQFPYELTPDQAQSCQDIYKDMESDTNMDRLLCGDVGYGKTEVALRAAFKAVMDSKQVAILAPTTILAQQHYNTVKKRFAGFPVKADVVSRFRTPKEQKEILSQLKIGSIDILIGTHRLLAKDVKFKDLGLLIVDEEQRFGVSHKEVIKNMKQTVDVLTLSATPIPRTLHMSMVGIRDMSVLETPPEERFPVQTHVMEYSDAIIRDAILREVGRGGQVYFLYNRVHSIEQFYNRLRALVPEVRIGVAHGQMKEHALEDCMMDFYSGTYDVLLCTTIIESGLDVPSANTLIVFDADRFGLSQLYQLRGRVGRSNRQAYAYFTVRPEKMLSETAQKRLSAIKEFTEFGAGFRIAMRDLEIRGAGNILGPEQHGQMSTIGYDMYCKLMEQTLAEARGLPMPKSNLETRVELKVDAFLPPDYVSDEKQRMEIYKKIASIEDRASREDLEDELIDRYGDIPEAAMNLIDIAHLRAMARSLDFSRVFYRGNMLVLLFDSDYAEDPVRLVQAVMACDPRLRLSAAKPASLMLADNRLDQLGMLKEGVKVLEKLINYMKQQVSDK